MTKLRYTIRYKESVANNNFNEAYSGL
jgi:hypothetical protein